VLIFHYFLIDVASDGLCLFSGEKHFSVVTLWVIPYSLAILLFTINFLFWMLSLWRACRLINSRSRTSKVFVRHLVTIFFYFTALFAEVIYRLLTPHISTLLLELLRIYGFGIAGIGIFFAYAVTSFNYRNCQILLHNTRCCTHVERVELQDVTDSSRDSLFPDPFMN